MWLSLIPLAFLAAHVPSNATSGPWSAELNGTWLWHEGDDMQWASPSLDDSKWPQLTMPGPPPSPVRYWIRIPVRLRSVSDPGIMLGPVARAYEVYWDGRRIGNFGDPIRGRWFVPRWQSFRLPRHLAEPGVHQIAIRVAKIGTGFGTRQPRLLASENRIGEFSALQESVPAHTRADLHPRLFLLLLGFGYLLAGLYFLLLPPSVSQGGAFRWLGVMLLGRALLVMCEFYANDGPLDAPGNELIVAAWGFTSLSFIGTVEFPYALFRRQAPLAIRCFECFLVVFATPILIPYSALLLRFTVALVAGCVPIAVATEELRKRTVDAGSALALFILIAAASLQNMVATALHVSNAVFIAGFQLWSWDLALLLWVPAITMQIHKANLRFRDEQQHLRREIEAARHVQEILLPFRVPHVPGFEIGVAYQPAMEVGGDFFQFFPAPSDSLLVVVGDVSGKGMKAALLVSVIVGALQNRKSDQPAEVLRGLNAVLLGRSEGGFTTCCCALFQSDGGLTIANAGHLAPYRNGKEIETDPGLPLGIVREANWQETRIELQPCDRMVWISDGVVEARNGRHDLLGFERAGELATRSASEIAQAAQQFGQDDDITVVSITRQPAPAYVV